MAFAIPDLPFLTCIEYLFCAAAAEKSLEKTYSELGVFLLGVATTFIIPPSSA
jgi:hypothetical protein